MGNCTEGSRNVITVFGKDVPTHLHELIEPTRSALLIIDMQNDFCSPDGSAAQAGADVSMYTEIVPRIAAVASACRKIEVPVIHIRMTALPNGQSDSPAWIRLRMRASQYQPKSDDLWPFAIEGTRGAEFVTELQPQPGDLVVTKYRSSAFWQTELDIILSAAGITTVIVAGATTEGCVESTVRDAGFHDYFPVVLSDCVGSDVRALHDASLLVMSAYRADVATHGEVVKAWSEMGLLEHAG